MVAIPNQMCIMDSEERIQNQTRGHKPKEKIGGKENGKNARTNNRSRS